MCRDFKGDSSTSSPISLAMVHDAWSCVNAQSLNACWKNSNRSQSERGLSIFQRSYSYQSACRKTIVKSMDPLQHMALAAIPFSETSTLASRHNNPHCEPKETQIGTAARTIANYSDEPSPYKWRYLIPTEYKAKAIIKGIITAQACRKRKLLH